MRVVSAIVLAFCSIWLFCQPAFAERRIALVIGNSAYERVPQLPNPVNDATSMSEMFKRAGFDTVVLELDVKAMEMRHHVDLPPHWAVLNSTRRSSASLASSLPVPTIISREPLPVAISRPRSERCSSSSRSLM
jgi:caspase domain-containing protein